MNFLYEFWHSFICMFTDMSFYIILGLLCVGVLHVFVKKESILKHLGKDRFSSVVKASAVGVPLPLCSCGVVPTAIELKKGGASNGAVISFLTSTPQTGVDSIFATYSLMGPIMAIFRPIAAFCSGIIGGAFVNLVAKDAKGEDDFSNVTSCCGDKSNENKKSSCCGGSEVKIEVEETPKSSCCCSGKSECGKDIPENVTKQNKLFEVFKYAFGDFLDEISIHFLIGMIIASCISVLLPADFFVSMGLHKGIFSMLAMVLIGLPMYICSASSIPIAMSLMAKGLSLGGGFVFLFTGPVTNIASLLVLSKALGKKVTGIYIASVVVCSMAFGYILDMFVSGLTFSSMNNMSGHAGHGETEFLALLSTWIFAILITKGLVVNILHKIKKA